MDRGFPFKRARKERGSGVIRIANIKVLRSVDPILDKEAVRVVTSSPLWEPGRQGARPVNVTYQFPVIFQLR